MKPKFLKHIVVFTLTLGFMTACAGNYGTLSPQTGRIGIADLADSLGDHIIHSSSWQSSTPAALMFDPKNNATTLTGSAWTRIDDPAEVSEIIEIINRSYPYRRVFELTGPDGQPLGYLISPTRNIYVKAVDEKTFSVSGLRRPIDSP